MGFGLRFGSALGLPLELIGHLLGMPVITPGLSTVELNGRMAEVISIEADGRIGLSFRSLGSKKIFGDHQLGGTVACTAKRQSRTKRQQRSNCHDFQKSHSDCKKL